jgi:dihydrofolate reductase
MARLRVHNFTVSLDGFAAGPRQSPENPLGDGGLQLHEWIFQTKSMHELQRRDGGEAGVNDDLFRARTAGVGATIMGRNMFGPVRGPWPGSSWRPGWSMRCTWRSRPSCSVRASGCSGIRRRISRATRDPG